MASLSKKDQKILTIMLVLGFGYVLWTFGAEPVFNDYTELSESLTQEEEQYRKNVETLQAADKIELEYKRVEAQFPQDDPERDPSEVFNEDVVKLSEKVLGGLPTKFDPPTPNEIKGVPGYELLIMKLEVNGNLAKIAELLKSFDEKGYLIQQVELNRDNDLTKDSLMVRLTLGRIVKIDTGDEPSGPAAPGSLKLAKGRQ